VVVEQAEEVTERAEVEVPSQLGVSIQLIASLAQERGMELQQSGSPSVLMLASQIMELSPATRFSVTKPQSLRPPWFRCHLRCLKNIANIWETKLTKFSYISEREMQVDVPAKVLSSGDVITAEGISSIFLFFSSYEHYFNTRLTIICRSCHWCQSCNLFSY